MDKLKVEEGREWAQIEEENSKGIHSTFNACMFRGECRSKDAEIAELKRQLEDLSSDALVRANRIIRQKRKIVDMRRQLAESQAREVKYRDALENYKILCQDENHYSHYVDALKALALPHDDTALKEYGDAVIDECAVIAGNACLVPPDGGSPTVEEAAVSEEAARRIRNMKGGA